MIEPARIARLPHFRGFPVPWMMLTTDGVPDFKVLDLRRIVLAAEERLCGICGERLGVRLWFVGGVNSCNAGTFVDPPFHQQCAEYSFQVCPYLLGRVGYSTATPRVGERDELVSLAVADSDMIGMYPTRSFQVEECHGSLRFFAGPLDGEIIWHSRR